LTRHPSPLVLAAVLCAASAQAQTSVVQRAETMAAGALGKAASDPKAALADARRALALTADFEPTAFVRAGRKGEVVEDSYLAARDAYRQHRAGLYEAVGEALAAQGETLAASRYLRRAVTLESTPARVTRLARALVATGRGAEALSLLVAQAATGALTPEALALVEQSVDAAGLPGAQAEIDRARARALPGGVVEYRDGPFKPPAGARLSTGAPFRVDQGVVILYLAEVSCRRCSEDLEELQRMVPEGTLVAIVPEDGDRDQALRRVLGLYKHAWPVVLGRGIAEAMRMTPGSALIVARNGWVGLSVKPPFQQALAKALALVARADIQEARPRPAWSRRPIERRELAALPGLLPEGLAPGEDETAPAEFTNAVAAYRAGRFAEALRLFEEIDARGDGWLLPPEARINRALTLGKLGRREEARRLLLRTGDSRLLDAADRALEQVGRR
jgi:tetratricopeptide (TPR) repeat protein